MITKIVIALAFSFVITACNQVDSKNNEGSIIGQKLTKIMPVEKGGKIALVLIDIQNDYFPGGTMELVSADKAAKNAANMLSYFRENSLTIVHVKHLSLQDGATFFLPNTKGAEIHHSVVPLEGEKVITKNYPNSFRDTELLKYLKSERISQLVICGMMTDVCVDATTRASMDYGFANIIIADAVTTRNRDFDGKIIPATQVTEAYLAGLNALGGLYAKIESSKEYVKLMKRE